MGYAWDFHGLLHLQLLVYFYSTVSDKLNKPLTKSYRMIYGIFNHNCQQKVTLNSFFYSCIPTYANHFFYQRVMIRTPLYIIQSSLFNNLETLYENNKKRNIYKRSVHRYVGEGVRRFIPYFFFADQVDTIEVINIFKHVFTP